MYINDSYFGALMEMVRIWVEATVGYIKFKVGDEGIWKKVGMALQGDVGCVGVATVLRGDKEEGEEHINLRLIPTACDGDE